MIRWLTASIALVTALLFSSTITNASAYQLQERSLQLSTAGYGEESSYLLSMKLTEPETVGSVGFEFCSNSAYEESSCTAPVGFDVRNAQLTQQNGTNDFSVSNKAQPNKIVISRVPSVAAAQSLVYQFEGIINPTDKGTYFARIIIYSGQNASGSSIAYGTMAFSITNTFNISTQVLPYLLFCTATTIANADCAQSNGTGADFGELSSSQAKSATTQFLAATNAASGYNVRVTGSTLASGNDEIEPMSNGSVSRPGTSQFGMNLRSNSQPVVGKDLTGGVSSIPMPQYGSSNTFRFVSNEVIAMSSRPDYATTYTVSYVVNVPGSQAAGLYATTLTYICLANF